MKRRVYFPNMVHAADVAKAIETMIESPVITVIDHRDRLLLAERSEGLHRLVAAAQAGMPVRLRVLTSTNGLNDDDLANYLVSSFLSRPEYDAPTLAPEAIGLLSLEIEIANPGTGTIDTGER
jgi:hypothetical protein